MEWIGNPIGGGSYDFDFQKNKEELEKYQKERKKRQEQGYQEQGSQYKKPDEFTPQFELMGYKEELTLDDFIGQEAARKEAQRFILSLQNRDLCDLYGYNFPNLLFHGDIGVGKTYLAHIMASECRKIKDTLFISLNFQDFSSHYINRTSGNFAKTMDFIKARLKDPEFAEKYAVIFMDEYDSIGRQRGTGSEKGEDDKLVNAVNIYIDGDRKIPEISFIAATNFYDLLDRAQQSRFSIHVKFETFKKKSEMMALIKVHCKRANRKTKLDVELFKRLNYGSIADLIEGEISGRASKDIVDRVVGAKLNDLMTNKKSIKDYSINMGYFRRIIRQYNEERKSKEGVGFTSKL